MTDDPRAALYGAALGEFVAVRKQLAAAAKAGGDRALATELAKLSRPTPAAWAVNQLWRHARADWEQLLATTRAIGAGDLAAVAGQRAALATLRDRAIALARDHAQPASDAMLARLDINLRAIAATGWGEVAPGQLVDDRDPPGFEAMTGFALVPPPSAPPPSAPPPSAPPPPELDAAEIARRAALARAAEEAAARKRAAVAALRAEVDRRRVVMAEAAAAAALARAEADRAELRYADARARAEAAERELAAAQASPDAPLTGPEPPLA